jgi:hypothetical protein
MTAVKVVCCELLTVGDGSMCHTDQKLALPSFCRIWFVKCPLTIFKSFVTSSVSGSLQALSEMFSDCVLRLLVAFDGVT